VKRLALALTTAASPDVHAQRLRGVVRDLADGRPIPAAVVSLLDAAGVAQIRTLADENGRFLVETTPGAASVQIRRIGYRPRLIAVPDSARRVEGFVELSLERLPLLLEPVEAVDNALCSPRPDRGDALALWNQAQSAFLAAVIARAEKPAQVRLLSYNRSIDPRTRKPIHQTVQLRTGWSSRPFAAARSPAMFVTRGYLDENATGRTFYAPDADVLLDESFRLSHCFSLAPVDAAHAGQIALAFEPALGRDTVVDVAGVVWLDRSPLAVRSIDFTYTGVEPAVRSGGGGGFLSFMTLANGIPFVDQWQIRLVSLARVATPVTHFDPPATPRALRTDVHVTGVTHAGGEIRSIEWPGGNSWRSVLPELRGVVVERGTSRPLRGVRVTFSGSSYTTSSNADGSFVIPDVLPGPYQLLAKDTILERYGVDRQTRMSVSISRTAEDRVIVELPEERELVGGVCRGQSRARGPSAVVGRVMTVAQEAAPLASVTVVWTGPGNGTRIERDTASFRASDRGAFQLCGLKPGTLTLRAVAADSASGSATVVIPATTTLAPVLIVLQPKLPLSNR
jgi:hypothetical protein